MNIERRDFLKLAGGTAVGTALGLGLQGVILGRGREAWADHTPRNFAIKDGQGRTVGWFYSEANGPFPEHPELFGYPVVDDGEARMWTAFQRNGGVGRNGAIGSWGYPVSLRWRDEIGRVNQAFQRGIFQIDNRGNVSWANVFDVLRDRRIKVPGIPDYFPFGSSLVERVFTHPSVDRKYLDIVRRFFLSNPNWLNQYGYPRGARDYGEMMVVVAQRAAFQYKKTPNRVDVVLGGDIAKDYGIVPAASKDPVSEKTLGRPGEVLAPGEFRIGNILFRNFGEHRGYAEDTFNWLRGTGARTSFRGRDVEIWKFIQDSPIPYILFDPRQQPPEFTDAFTGYVGLNQTGLYNPDYNREAQGVTMIAQTVHGAVHSRQFKEVNYNPRCGQMLNFEIEAWITDIQIYRALMPFVGPETQGQLAFAANWREEQVRNRNLPYCLP